MAQLQDTKVYVVTYALSPEQKQLCQVMYKHKDIAYRFRDEVIADGCKALVRELEPEALTGCMAEQYDTHKDFYRSL